MHFRFRVIEGIHIVMIENEMSLSNYASIGQNEVYTKNALITHILKYF